MVGVWRKYRRMYIDDILMDIHGLLPTKPTKLVTVRLERTLQLVQLATSESWGMADLQNPFARKAAICETLKQEGNIKTQHVSYRFITVHFNRKKISVLTQQGIMTKSI